MGKDEFESAVTDIFNFLKIEEAPFHLGLSFSDGGHSLVLMNRGNNWFVFDPNKGLICYDDKSDAEADLVGAMSN